MRLPRVPQRDVCFPSRRNAWCSVSGVMSGSYHDSIASFGKFLGRARVGTLSTMCLALQQFASFAPVHALSFFVTLRHNCILCHPLLLFLPLPLFATLVSTAHTFVTLWRSGLLRGCIFLKLFAVTQLPPPAPPQQCGRYILQAGLPRSSQWDAYEEDVFGTVEENWPISETAGIYVRSPWMC